LHINFLRKKSIDVKKTQNSPIKEEPKPNKKAQ